VFFSFFLVNNEIFIQPVTGIEQIINK